MGNKVKSLGSFLDKILDRIFAVLGALIFSQGPAFIQQYIQSLAGSVAELNLQVVKMKSLAKNNGKGLDAFIQKFVGSSDADISGQGEIMNFIVSRYTSLSDSLEVLNSSHWWSKPFYFVTNFHNDIFFRTADFFRPAVNISIEGVLFALVGLLFGYLLYTSIRDGIYSLFKSSKPQSKVDDASTDHKPAQ